MGKLVVFIVLVVGLVVVVVKKDWLWFFGVVVLFIGVGILVGIVNVFFMVII